MFKLPQFLSNLIHKDETATIGYMRPEETAQEASNSFAPINLAYYLEANVSIFADIVQTVKTEVFRNGISWIPRFVCKCPQCSTEFDEERTVCDCGCTDLIKPDKTQLKRFDRPNGLSYLARANLNDESLKNVLEDFQRHAFISDNAFLLCLKKYSFIDENQVIAQPIELLSVHPTALRAIMQKNGLPGGSVWFCIEHRSRYFAEKDKLCPDCGRALHEAHYETTSGEKKYYLRDEVYLMQPMYGGTPSILKMQIPALTFQYLEKGVLNHFRKGRPPGFLAFPTSNAVSLKAALEALKDAARKDPADIQSIAFDPGQGKGAAQFVKLLEDPGTNLLEIKKELRDRLCSFYGVSPVFMADTSASGGLNNEGLQITVTNKATQFWQQRYNGDPETNFEDGLLAWICRQFGITDFVLQLNPSEEDDQMAEEQRFSQKVWNAKVMLDMGFDVRYENKEFKFSGQAMKLIAPPALAGGGNKETVGEVGNINVSTSNGPPEEAGGGSTGPKLPVGGVPAQNRPAGAGQLPKADIKKEDENDLYEFDEYNEDQLIKSYASDAIKAIKMGALYPFYKDVPDEDIPAIHAVITEQFKNKRLSLAEMIKQITERTDLDKEKARLIARTETTNVVNTAREIGYKRQEDEDPDTDYLYKWSVKHDHRTSQICKDIEAEVGAGVPLEELKRIVGGTSAAAIPGWAGEFVAHPNCRSTVVRTRI